MLLWFVGGSILLVMLVFQSPAIDYRMVANEARLVLDTRNVCAKAGADMAKVVKA